MLYICATPIGNLEDITLRAINILNKSDIILCEDTRRSHILFNYHNIKPKKVVSLHEHNENEVTNKVIEWLEQDLIITQISDAGTPGISDPGSRLCNRITKLGFKISPLPGPCSFISLLSVSGINSPFTFYGFLPSQKNQRMKFLCSLKENEYPICVFESPHRIIECLNDIHTVFGDNCSVLLGRELTKQFETIKKLNIINLIEFVKSDLNQQKGEFVLIIEPVIEIDEELTNQQIMSIKTLLTELPPKKSVNLTHKLFGGNKDKLYKFAISTNINSKI